MEQGPRAQLKGHEVCQKEVGFLHKEEILVFVEACKAGTGKANLRVQVTEDWIATKAAITSAWCSIYIWVTGNEAWGERRGEVTAEWADFDNGSLHSLFYALFGMLILFIDLQPYLRPG